MHKFSSIRNIMDASASTKTDADKNAVYDFYLKIDGHNYPTQLKQKNTVTKYTKLPEFEFDSKVSWPPHSYTLHPRLRRIIALDDDELMRTNRSLMHNPTTPSPIMASANFTKRKIVTISEDDENDLHPKFLKVKRLPVKTSNRSVEADFKDKQLSHRTTSRLSGSPKCPKEIKTSAKTNSANIKKEVTVPPHNPRGKNPTSIISENNKIKNVKDKEKEPLRTSRSLNPPSKISISKNLVVPSESEKELSKIKHILYDNLKSKSATYKKPTEKPKHNKLPHVQNKPKVPLIKEIQNKGRPLTVIHVPIEDNYRKNVHTLTDPLVEPTVTTVDCASYTDNSIHYKDAEVATDPLPTSVSRITEMDGLAINAISMCESTMQTDLRKEMFDSLEIPNVTLTKDKCEPKEDPSNFNTTSLPNLNVPHLKIVPSNADVTSSDLSFCQGASYIIRRATVTYTTRQKFNIQLVGNDDDVRPTTPLPSPLNYPMSVVSVFKNELKDKNAEENESSDDSHKKKTTAREEYLNCLNDLKSLNCSYVFNKLMKPSDIISTIRVNNGLLQSDYICEQFQRELNFIDSFFESLQYLESCSLAGKCYSENKVENFVNNSVLFDSTFDAKNSEYDNFLSKIENGANIDDSETIASKSLCLLNLLIRDEQRRARNLLFVLKMREDALKDFTKSQILWLEKKKKHDNTDISTLKKKQRGALLKLQHECGEMQRMRKALLTLSEKRKVALMKTKKNIELKLKNNVDVEQIILGKKKLKRSTFDRNAAPLKCFDLSSSGCEESTTSRGNSEPVINPVACEEVAAPMGSGTSVTSAEKCVQTSSDVTTPELVDHATDTADENFVVVDGGYLNILFHNLTLPQIFSNGKQYEVNEEALKNIVSSSNHHNANLSGSDVVEKLMDQIKNKDSDKSSSSPSTARSLIDEFDQYYKDLQEVDKSRPCSPDPDIHQSSKVYEIKDSSVQSVEIRSEQLEERCSQTMSKSTLKAESSSLIEEKVKEIEEACVCESAVPADSDFTLDKESATSQTLTGPLPVPVGAAAVVDSAPPDAPTWLTSKSSASSASELNSVSSQPVGNGSSISSLTAPVHVEAEELRRQQLEIEREIKALEQQQCRLLVVREIPDKPPPPYTPPTTETRAPKPPRMFTPDERIHDKVEKHITDPDGTYCDETDAFDVLVQDYCRESLERHKQDQSDKPWDACNLLPQKPQVQMKDLVRKTTTELKEVLTGVTPAAVSGVSSRRSDHIDDILFAEWRRCEPEWTALHTDEAIVKNQIFESIFQKILTDTIDEYKKTVQCEVLTPD
ncbi:uncharacterized protein LOC124644848 isoform X1 [Helicoverpa zea]|uniref:uncharacterized protein LOC124644848 isoform X1 n=1 Tax=Helicoverpa zea TaxID=7113 RepID=UPI001F57091C|nr:uncharacterized protein LOC124644848 isoform X1 [Helicoverpa zea]